MATLDLVPGRVPQPALQPFPPRGELTSGSGGSSRTEAMVPIDQVSAVTEHTTARAIERRSLQCGRSRSPVTDLRGRFVGLVHIREATRSATSDCRIRKLSWPTGRGGAMPMHGYGQHGALTVAAWARSSAAR